MNDIDVYELAMWVWLASLAVIGLFCYVVAALQRWLDRNKPRNRYVRRDWSTEQRCKVTRRAFKTRAGLKS